MQIGEKFIFNSYGKIRSALFLQQKNNKIHAVICDDRTTQGITVKIDFKQIILINEAT